MTRALDNLLDKSINWGALDWEKVLYLLLIILALSARLWGLGIRVQSHDESLHTKYSWNLYVGQGFQHTPLMHGPFLFHATALSYFLFGANDFTARLVVALIGVALVAFPYLLRRWLGKVGALFTSFFLLISPSIAYYSRYIRHDIPVILWSLIVIFAVFSYLRDGRERWLYLMAGGVSLMFATKEVAFIYNAILGFFLLGLLAYQILEREPEREQPLFGTLWDYRAFDLVILLGTLCLPFLSSIPIKLAGLNPTDHSRPTIYYSGAITGVVLTASVIIGLAWSWRRWLTAAAIHYGIFVVLFTTVFTNGTGIASGMVGSMGYWVEQQGVKRGDQPWYYYGITIPLYEYLPLLLTFITSAYLVIRSAFSDLKNEIQNSKFLVFLLWWMVMAWAIYSYAGEKMPWLTVHLALPMILLSGWGIGRFVRGINWQRVLQQRTWLLSLIAPPFVMALTVFIYALLSGPFQGYTLGQLNVTGQVMGGAIGTIAFGTGLVYLIQRGSWRTSLRFLLLIALLVPVLLTVRHAWHFCYVNYSYPIEHLVYAHAGPAVKDTMRQIEELSRRIAGGPKLIKVAYGADGSWPFHWYLRDYPNAVFYGEEPSREQMDAPVVIAGSQQWGAVDPYLSKDYTDHTYTYLWWPMEDYKNLTWQKIRRAITDPKMRAALWDIWYDRDYRRYDNLFEDKSYTLNEWPLRSEYRLYIRRDVVAQMWDRGMAEPIETGPADPYAEGWRDLAARRVFGTQGSAEGQFKGPRGLDVGPDGFVYVADAGNHRVQKFTANGEFVAAWGREAASETESAFKEPWDVAVAPGGGIYVADTWMHRVVKLTPQGEWSTAWGMFGQYDPGSSAGKGAFYGPRGIALAPDERVYMTDTGNKRVQVFEPDGAFSSLWSRESGAQGSLDEPVGIALGPDGEEVYVSDTWNRQVQVFAPDGSFLRKWSVKGWDAGIPEEKPYLAVDSQGHVYVTDPGNYRVLVFDAQGNYLLSFGQYGTDERSFALPTGIAVAEDDSIYVSDAHGNRVLVFDPIDFGMTGK